MPSLHVQLGTTMSLHAAHPVSPGSVYGQHPGSSTQYDVIHRTPGGYFSNQHQTNSHYSHLPPVQPAKPAQPAGFFGSQPHAQQKKPEEDIYGPVSICRPKNFADQVNFAFKSMAFNNPNLCVILGTVFDNL